VDVLANSLAQAVAPGDKGVNLEPAAGGLPDGGLNDGKSTFAAFPSAFLNPAKCSLRAGSILEFPAAERVLDVLVVIVWPETCELIGQ
jgi:hypothetical protein